MHSPPAKICPSQVLIELWQVRQKAAKTKSSIIVNICSAACSTMIHWPAGWGPNCLILGCENTRQKCLEFQAGSSESCFKVVTVLLLALDLSKLNSWRTHLTRLKYKLYTWLSINVRHMYLNRASFVSELPAAANPAKTQCLGRGNINIFSPLRLCRRQAPKGCRILGLHHHL